MSNRKIESVVKLFMIISVFFLMLVTLASCAPEAKKMLVKPGLTEEQYTRDSAQCHREVGWKSSFEVFRSRSDLFIDCMKRKNYRLVSPDTPREEW